MIWMPIESQNINKRSLIDDMAIKFDPLAGRRIALLKA
jgi:hypothetical protein